MRKDYRKGDFDQQVNSREFLNTYRSKDRPDNADLKQYCRQFNAVSRHLVQKGTLGAYERAVWFVQGLPGPKVRERVVRKGECDADDAETIKYDKLYGVAMTVAEAADTFKSFTTSDKDR